MEVIFTSMSEVREVALLVTIALMIVPLSISYQQHLRLEKDILWSSFRGFLQLLLVGYVITFVFSIETWYVLTGLLLLMIMVAAVNASKRGKWLSSSLVIAFTSILIAVVISISLWIIFSVVPFKAQYILPMSGMIIGNSMVICGLTFERMYNDFQQTKEFIIVKLALGATPRQASQELIEKTIKTALIPSIDSFKTTGLVHLPGMMTGMIIAGASPVEAVKYQIVIMFSLMTSAVLSAMMVSFLAYRHFFIRAMF
jgi:putative ABC transport system permease protein